MGTKTRKIQALDIYIKLVLSIFLLFQHQATATFNFLNGEQRYVAAALLPPKKIIKRDMSEFLLPDAQTFLLAQDQPINPNYNPEKGVR